MNIFDDKLKEYGKYPLTVNGIDTLVVNMGFKCTSRCMYYYVDALAGRTDEMSLGTIDRLLRILKGTPEISGLEIIGGSPEQNPHFRYFVKSAARMGKKLAVVSDLALYAEPDMEDMPQFLADYGVKVLAYLSHFNAEIADRQMGAGAYGKIRSALKKLNETGYGREGSALKMALVFFPNIAELPPDKNVVADAYAKNLKDKYGIEFNHLIVFNNMPVGRFEHKRYMSVLEEKFNPDTIEGLPCRHVIGVSPDGRFYDCDFHTVLDIPVECESTNVDNFSYNALNNKKIATGPLCLTCTAGEGASCAECCE